MRTFLPVSLPLLVASCGGAGRVAPDPLPFRVAVVPPEVRRLPREAEEEPSVRLALDEAGVRHRLVEALGLGAFTEAVLLQPPAGEGGEDFDARPRYERDEHWMAAAYEARADLLLECEVLYDEEAWSVRNDRFWLNLPLFGLGGPACYFVEDRTYHASARVRGSLHDLNAILDGLAGLGDGRARLVELTASFEGAAMDFLDRSGGAPHRVLASLVIPAGLLAKEGPRVERRLAEDVVTDLGRAFVEEIHSGTEEILRADRVSPFHLRPGWSWERVGEDGWLLRGELALLEEAGSRLNRWRLAQGERMVEGVLDAWSLDPELSRPRERWSRHVLEARLPGLDPEAPTRLELIGGGRDMRRRTYTLAPAVASR